MTSPSSQPQNRRGSMKHGEILNVLRNSPKGQLHYDTGWDEMGYYAVAVLLSFHASLLLHFDLSGIYTISLLS